MKYRKQIFGAYLIVLFAAILMVMGISSCYKKTQPEPKPYELPKEVRDQLITCYKSKFIAKVETVEGDTCLYLFVPKWSHDGYKSIQVGFDFAHLEACPAKNHRCR